METIQIISQPSVILEKTCAFCHRFTNDPVQYGEFCRTEGIAAHYFCVLLSSALLQNGMDNEGIHGFRIRDILSVLKDTATVTCIYCHLPNATIICRQKGCKRTFHYPCGLENGAVACFSGNFLTCCGVHNQNRKQNKRRLEAAKEDMNCIYCRERIAAHHNYYTAACCKRCQMHVNCLRMHALAFGYLTRCPNCTNLTTFVASIRKNGVYIPESDPMWNVDNEAVQEYARVSRVCEVNPCLCRHGVGSAHDAKSGNCKLIVCEMCGGNAAHYKCMPTTGSKYFCTVCRPIIYPQKDEEESNRNKNPLVMHRQKNEEKSNRNKNPLVMHSQKNEEESNRNKNPFVLLVRMDLNQIRAARVHTPCSSSPKSQKLECHPINEDVEIPCPSRYNLRTRK